MSSTYLILVVWSVGVLRSIPAKNTVTCEAPFYHRKIAVDYEFDPYYGNRRIEKRTDPCDERNKVTVNIICTFVSNATFETLAVAVPNCPYDRITVHFKHNGLSKSTLLDDLVTNFKMSEVYLDGIGITKISLAAFNHQPKLQVVSLRDNYLNDVGVGIFNHLIDLKTLDLSGNQIKGISEEAFAGISVQQLYLSHNLLTSLSDSFCRVSILDLSYNKIDVINPLLSFETIKLNVSNNMIKNVTLDKFPYLVELDLANNNLECLDAISDSLETLNVDNNKIRTIPEDMKHLQKFRVSGNLIQQLPNVSAGGGNLTELYLANNSLSSIPHNYFKEMVSLQILDLSQNMISGFVFGTFDSLSQLEVLNISHNRLETLPTHTFHSMENLTQIYLSHNRISELNVDDLLEYHPGLETVDLRENSWSCNRLLQTIRKLKSQHVRVVQGEQIEDSNIHGIACTDVGKTVDVKEKDVNSDVLDYFNKEFKNSNFVKYLERFKSISDDRELVHNVSSLLTSLNKLIETEVDQNGLLNEKFKTLDDIASILNRTEATFENLLNRTQEKNYSKANFNTTKELELVWNITNSNEARYVDLMKQHLDKDSNFTEELKQSLEQAVNSMSEVLRRALIQDQHDSSKVMTDELLDRKEQQALHSSEAEARSSPIFVFIAILLSAITVFIAVLGYVVIVRLRYTAKKDVELTELIEPKPDSGSS